MTSRSSASTQAHADREFVTWPGSDVVVLCRHLQEEAEGILMTNWKATDDGKKYLQKAKQKVPQRARPHYEANGWTWSPGPDEQLGRQVDGSQGQRLGPAASMRSYWKTHCEQAYGGVNWVKFILTLGEVPDAVVDAKNHLDFARTVEKRGVPRTRGEADVTVTGNYLSRAHRASTPAPEDYVKPKRL